MILASLHKIHCMRLWPLHKNIPIKWFMQWFWQECVCSQRTLFLQRANSCIEAQTCFPSGRSGPLRGELDQSDVWAEAWSLACKKLHAAKHSLFLRNLAKTSFSNLLLQLKILARYLNMQSCLGKVDVLEEHLHLGPNSRRNLYKGPKSKQRLILGASQGDYRKKCPGIIKNYNYSSQNSGN